MSAFIIKEHVDLSFGTSAWMEVDDVLCRAQNLLPSCIQHEVESPGFEILLVTNAFQESIKGQIV